MEYKITIDKFEGPLDLLLHLIKQADIDIFDINISDITNQYLMYINKMKELNLDVDSQYIVMAADLIEIKAKELLPKEEEIEEDPKEELINRLVEYQMYKNITDEFKQMEKERQMLFSKNSSYLDEYKDDGIKISGVSLEDLINAFSKFQERKNFEKPLNTVITKKEYSVSKRSREIMNRLNKSGKIKFTDLFDNYNKQYVVVTFLSILDLAKNGKLFICQEHNLDDILITKGELL